MDRRYAILGDVHANIEALQATIEDARQQGVTDFVCVGDIVGYNANPCECVDLVREIECVTVRGNHDHYCSHDERLEDFQPLAANVIDWTRRQLRETHVRWLSGLPLSRVVGGFTLVHSTLDMPDHWGYVFDLLDAEAHFNYQTTALCFHGHTHVPLVFEKRNDLIRAEPAKFRVSFGSKYFVNTGSVGQPRDGIPRCSYVLYNQKLREVEFRRVSYDVELAIDRNRRAGLPDRLSERLSHGR
jgi:diadenosine tetraphosphatase ApaH/serine/threonine PP2A family protein phosphatase